MPKAARPELQPRKTPVQARSHGSVQAIREATVQVLLSVGKENLTTTKVAARAGVSVGTLYQYFPNKSSLLQAVLKAHLNQVYEAVEAACESVRGAPLEQMADALITAFLKAKMRSEATSRALYFVSDDVGGAEIARIQGSRGVRAIAAMLETAPEGLREEAEVIAATLMAAMAGVSRRMLVSGATRNSMEAMQRELVVMVRAYVNACAA